MLKDEKGMTKIELVVGIIVVIIIVAFGIFLSIGEREPKNNETENIITNEIDNSANELNNIENEIGNTANEISNTANEIGNTVSDSSNENTTDNNNT